jgi:hypothetical protein
MHDHETVTSLRQESFPTHDLPAHPVYLPCSEDALVLHEHPI